jgi:hypothetical protein
VREKMPALDVSERTRARENYTALLKKTVEPMIDVVEVIKNKKMACDMLQIIRGMLTADQEKRGVYLRYAEENCGSLIDAMEQIADVRYAFLMDQLLRFLTTGKDTGIQEDIDKARDVASEQMTDMMDNETMDDDNEEKCKYLLKMNGAFHVCEGENVYLEACNHYGFRDYSVRVFYRAIQVGRNVVNKK